MPTTPYYPSGSVQHWNLSVARQMPMNIAVELAYVGSKGSNLNARSTLLWEFPDVQKLVTSKIPAWDSLPVRVKGHNSNYHAFQAKASKRMTAGLSFLAAFTWSHARAEASNDGVNENTIREADEFGTAGLFVERKWSDADFDVRKRFSFSSTYEIPFGKGRLFGTHLHPVVNAFVGGWRLNMILTLQDGFPHSIVGTNGRVPAFATGTYLQATVILVAGLILAVLRIITRCR
jgi:hypothetical protein